MLICMPAVSLCMIQFSTTYCLASSNCNNCFGADSLLLPHLAQTTMGLAGQAGNTPTLHHTLDTVTLGDGNGVNHLVGLEDSVNRHLLLKQTEGEVNLLVDGATVDLQMKTHSQLAY